MPRFFFRLRSPGRAVEVEEVELPDRRAARREALQACSDMMREANGEAAEWDISVTNEEGHTVFALHVSAEEPAGS